ncbi:MAG: pilus assembly protein TadG-related protein [Dehalococcoidia bacterium]
MSRIRTVICREDAQTVVVGAFAALAVMSVLAVSFDIGGAWLQRRNLQNVADAAALAGAQSLTGDSSGNSTAEAMALDYVEIHSGLEASDATASAADTEITVLVNKSYPRVIAGALGLGDATITAHAKARIASQNLPGKGVVPIGVEKSDWDNRTSGELLLKDKGQDGVNSNAGLVNIIGDTGDQIRDGLKYGSGTPLQPTLDTEPGNKFGQATQNNNSGLHVRLSRAITHTRPDDASKHCYTWAEVQPPSSGVWQCSPFTATESDGVQATSVILVPIIVEDFTQLNGNKTIHVYKDGDVYILAYFWVDGNKTYADPANGNYTSITTPKGQIWGQFIENVPTQLTVFDPNNCRQSDGCTVIDFDPDSILKIVQLIE